MKVLIVIPAIGEVYGGPSRIALDLAYAFTRQNIEIFLVTTNANGQNKLDVTLNVWIKQNGYQIQYFPYFSFRDYKFSFSLHQWLFENVKEFDLVNIISNFSIPNLSAYWACQKYNVPYVINPQGMLEPWALQYKGIKKKIYYQLLEKPSISKACALQMLSRSESEKIKSLDLKVPLFIAPNGINLEDCNFDVDSSIFLDRFPNTKNRQLILFLGRIDPKKGLDLLAPAFAKVYQKFPNTHLVIAGPDNVGYLPTVKNYFEELGCLDGVTFTGMLTGEMKYSALSAASIYVAPSYSEGFSMSILEGMASGLPCIFTTGCNFPEAQETNTAYVVDIDSESIEKALLKCLENPTEAKQMGHRAQKFILENYTWDEIAKKLIKVYQKIIDKKN